MRLLLDSHVLFWSLAERRRLTPPVRAEINNIENEVYVSVASAWELAIKAALGRLRLPGNLEKIVAASGFQKLEISFAHAAAAGALPQHHKDPFDRMLIAQARSESLTLVSRDRQFSPYGVSMLWA